jgi:hypothetical protein
MHDFAASFAGFAASFNMEQLPGFLKEAFHIVICVRIWNATL